MELGDRLIYVKNEPQEEQANICLLVLPSLHPRVHDQRRGPTIAAYKYSERSISIVAGVVRDPERPLYGITWEMRCLGQRLGV